MMTPAELAIDDLEMLVFKMCEIAADNKLQIEFHDGYLRFRSDWGFNYIIDQKVVD